VLREQRQLAAQGKVLQEEGVTGTREMVEVKHDELAQVRKDEHSPLYSRSE